MVGFTTPSTDQMALDSQKKKKDIECVHRGHIEEAKHYNDFCLGNKLYFYANIFYWLVP